MKKEQAKAKRRGYVVLQLPPGSLLDLWQDNPRFKAGYLNKFPGYYFSGDGGYKDEEDYILLLVGR
jgi:propionyl-CoA synthetase